MKHKHVRKAAMILAIAATVTMGVGQGAIVPGENGQAIVLASVLTSQTPVVSIASRTATTAKLTISGNQTAASYQVYRSTSKNGTYTYVGSANTSTFKDTGLKASKDYFYKVTYAGSSTGSSVVKLGRTIAKVNGVSGTTTAKGNQLTWSRRPNASSYQIYRSTSQSGTYSFLGTSQSTSYTDTTAKSGQTYYYKVRGVKVSQGATFYGRYSDVTRIASDQNNNSTSGNASNQSFVNEVLKLINQERAKEGLSTVSSTTTLQNAAYARAIETKSVFSHTRPDGTSCFTILAEYGISYRACGENIAYGQSTPAEVMNSWMNSSGHRANIMSENFGKVGIGCYYSNGTYYWTQLFTN